MNYFYAYNPTKILFGRGMIARMPNELAGFKKILFLHGKQSAYQNGVDAQVRAALKNIEIISFADIEPNPEYETCLKALKIARDANVDFILAAGGGSVMDAAKFIALSFHSDAAEPWDIITKTASIPAEILPFGCIATIPASGSESNNALVLSRHAQNKKISFNHIGLYPRFSVLDPETTLTLPWDRTAEGITDMFVHVLEQYITYPAAAPLQDRQAEALLATIIETAPLVKADPKNYDHRATLMWTAAQAVNGLISRGVPIDWSTHMIAHELTVLYNIPHARTLTLVLPSLYRHQFEKKKSKLAQYGRRIWQLTGSDDDVAHQAITKTEEFFKSLDMPLTFNGLGLKASDVAPAISKLLDVPGFAALGENKDITPDIAETILLQVA